MRAMKASGRSPERDGRQDHLPVVRDVPAENIEPAELHREYHNQEDREDEVRHGHEPRGHKNAKVVHGPVLVHRRKDAKDETKHDCKDEGAECRAASSSARQL